MAHRPLRLLVPALLLGACSATGFAVEAKHDPDFDFREVKTYDWGSLPAQSGRPIHDTSTVQMLAEQLQQSGLTRDTQAPDVLVRVQRSIAGQQHTRGWGYTTESGRVRGYTLQEGTLIIDLVDAGTDRLVWRGTAEGAFRFEDDPANQAATIRALLADMFADFPPGKR